MPRIHFEELTMLPGMPPLRTLRRLVAKHPAFPLAIDRVGRVRWRTVDPWQAVSFILACWPDEPTARTIAAEERQGTIVQLAETYRAPSVVTIRKLIDTRPDFPLIERAGWGTSARLDLALASAWMLSNWRDGRRRAE